MNINGIEIKDNLDVLVIVGPTASGKTALSIELAKKLNGEIISGDAFQVYKNMDIGTAKVSIDEMDGIDHHLIDIVDYDYEYDVSIFQKMAREKISEIKKRKKLPIIAGGTGLYIKACLFEYEFEHDPKLKETQEFLNTKDLSFLQDYCKDNNIKLNNSEINNHKHLVNIVAKNMLNISNNKKGNIPHYKNFQIICINVDREVLYDRINKRVDEMFQAGLVDEVKLFKPGFMSQLAIGYKEIHNSMDDLDYARHMIKQNSRNFAKRQVSWFSNQMEIEHYKRNGDIWQLHKN